MNYRLEELIPIVEMLSKKYTSGESTSVTYEKAQQLVEAVIYSIEMPENMEGENIYNVSGGECSAKEAYLKGCHVLVECVKNTQNNYNKMIEKFDSYGNENYFDTVTKAIPGFFKYYDAKFSPQSTIITMDYPTLKDVGNKPGIIAINNYVNYISLEQIFLGKFKREYVCKILSDFQPNYTKQFYNICNIMLRHTLACIFIGKNLMNEAKEEDYAKLKSGIIKFSREDLTKYFNKYIQEIIIKKWDGNRKLEEYLKGDINDFVTDLKNGAEYGCLEKIVVL